MFVHYHFQCFIIPLVYPFNVLFTVIDTSSATIAHPEIYVKERKFYELKRH